MVGRSGKQVARNLDIDKTNGGPRCSGAHSRGREAPGFYRRPSLAKAVRALSGGETCTDPQGGYPSGCRFTNGGIRT
jgi:hypothetical protein